MVLGFGCLLVDQPWLDDGGIETLGCLGRRLAERTTVPVSLLLNEAHTLEHGLRGIDAGFNALMLCTSDAETVAQLVRAAHERGVSVEGELGTLPDASPDGEIDPSRAELTDPEAAAAFVAATGVDCLAVSFGNVHTLEGGSAPVDLDHLAAILRAVRRRAAGCARRHELPAVSAVAGAISPDGVAKFNVGTVLKRTYLDGLGLAVTSAPPGASPHDLIGSHGPADLLAAAKPGLVEVVRRLIRVYRLDEAA